jgi:hypothetical protein
VQCANAQCVMRKCEMSWKIRVLAVQGLEASVIVRSLCIGTLANPSSCVAYRSSRSCLSRSPIFQPLLTSSHTTRPAVIAVGIYMYIGTLWETTILPTFPPNLLFSSRSRHPAATHIIYPHILPLPYMASTLDSNITFMLRL